MPKLEEFLKFLTELSSLKDFNISRNDKWKVHIDKKEREES